MAAGVCFEPRFLDLLFDEDLEEYRKMRAVFARSAHSILRALQIIRDFVIRKDSEDWKRSLVCGVCWLSSEKLAINVRNLRFLLGMSRSQVHSALQKVGYITVPSSSYDLYDKIPILEQDRMLAKEWTLKTMSPVTPQPAIPDFELPNKVEVFPNSPMPDTASFGYVPVEDVRRAEFTRRADELFGDMFCCTPLFLVDDYYSSVCR
jgi:hypothetical protein